jgi:hypothetical protein
MAKFLRYLLISMTLCGATLATYPASATPPDPCFSCEPPSPCFEDLGQ